MSRGELAMRVISLGCLIITIAGTRAAEVPALAWPTENNLLLLNKNDRFYMHVDRHFEGESTKPWQGGAFGFTRTPMRFSGRVIETKFHEGIDIKPLWRDENGAPTDKVRAIADGRVVHVNSTPGHSNYGNYVVVEHTTTSGPLYSLYAHLASAAVQSGAEIAKGGELGLLGWTGDGLNKERAHLHLELCLLLHSDFESWHAAFALGQNHNGTYNGLNLVGTDIARIYQDQAAGKVVDLPKFIRSQEVAWRAAIPRTERFELLSRYPWLGEGDCAGAPSVEISFSRDGQILGVKPFPTTLTGPLLLWVAETTMPTTIFTNRRITKMKDGCHLTGAGERFLRLIAGDFQKPVVPEGQVDAAAGADEP
ncbi:MAG: M23 family metallopeptidase [Verrucomicrobiales bacterium]